jgi:AraC-like DNA-binding protein
MAGALRDVPGGLETLAAGAQVTRHRHAGAYAAIVLSGGYEEAGDGGRWRVGPGDVLIHAGFAAHLDRIGGAGCRLLNLPLSGALPAEGAFALADPDAIVALAGRDATAAGSALFAQPRTRLAGQSDWPDQLAARLDRLEPLRLGEWAAGMGLAAESVSRGFRRVYGISPRRYRLEARVRHALRRLDRGASGLAALALECGFADQAHLTRAVSRLTGQPPGRWRKRQVNWVQ